MPPSRMETPARRSLLLLGGLAAGGMLAGCGMWPEEQKDKKPVLYLYPTTTMDLLVSLDYEGTLTYTYPTPQTQADGSITWHVTAAPDGDLTDAVGRHYPSLFWEGEEPATLVQNEGFVVEADAATGFLEDKLSLLGLSDREAAEFITFWGPRIAERGRALVTFASEEFVGVHPAGVVDYYVIGSPSGRYFKDGLAGVAIWVEREYHRAGPGGTGSAKAGGNYAASLLPQIQAEARGFSQVCFLDTYEGKYLEELGGMNMFVVMADGTVRTPELSGVILEGGTRSAILRMLRDEGVDVREEKIALSEVVDGIRSGAVAEVFACGTAAVVTPITRLGSDDFDVELEVGNKTREIHRRLTDIQWGRAEDPYGWTYRLI